VASGMGTLFDPTDKKASLCGAETAVTWKVALLPTPT